MVLHATSYSPNLIQKQLALPNPSKSVINSNVKHCKSKAKMLKKIRNVHPKCLQYVVYENWTDARVQ